VNVLSPGQIDTPDSQRINNETRQMFESLRLRGMQSDTFILPIWIALLVHGRV
jgi:hypothetical protein